MDYITLRKQVNDAGLLERQYGYYAFKFASTFVPSVPYSVVTASTPTPG